MNDKTMLSMTTHCLFTLKKFFFQTNCVVFCHLSTRNFPFPVTISTLSSGHHRLQSFRYIYEVAGGRFCCRFGLVIIAHVYATATVAPLAAASCQAECGLHQGLGKVSSSTHPPPPSLPFPPHLSLSLSFYPFLFFFPPSHVFLPLHFLFPFFRGPNPFPKTAVGSAERCKLHQ